MWQICKKIRKGEILFSQHCVFMFQKEIWQDMTFSQWYLITDWMIYKTGSVSFSFSDSVQVYRQWVILSLLHLDLWYRFIASTCSRSLHIQSGVGRRAQPNAVLEKVFTSITKVGSRFSFLYLFFLKLVVWGLKIQFNNKYMQSSSWVGYTQFCICYILFSSLLNSLIQTRYEVVCCFLSFCTESRLSPSGWLV